MDSRLEGASFSAALVIALFSTIDFLRGAVPEEDFEEAGEHIWPPIQYVPNLRGNMGSDEYLWADFWAKAMPRPLNRTNPRADIRFVCGILDRPVPVP